MQHSKVQNAEKPGDCPFRAQSGCKATNSINSTTPGALTGEGAIYLKKQRHFPSQIDRTPRRAAPPPPAQQKGTMGACELVRELKQAADADDQGSFALTLSQRLGIQRNDSDANAETIFIVTGPNVNAHGPARHDYCAVNIDAGGLDDPMAVAIARRPAGHPRKLNLTVHQFMTKTGYDRAPPNLQENYDLAVSNGALHIHPRSEDCDQALFDLVNQATHDIAGGDEHGRSGFAETLKETTNKTFSSAPQPRFPLPSHFQVRWLRRRNLIRAKRRSRRAIIGPSGRGKSLKVTNRGPAWVDRFLCEVI
jgi:hypothetical protein